jgi:hypothetical protein
MSARAHRLIVLGTALLFLASGCTTTPKTTLEGDDDVAFGDIEFSLPLARSKTAGRLPSHQLVASFSHAESDFDQTLGAGRTVKINNVEFSGTTLQADLDFYRWGIAYKRRIDTGQRVFVSPFAGLSLSQLDIELTAAGMRDSERIESIGPRAGLRVGYEPVEVFEIFLELDIAYGVGFDHLASTATQSYGAGIALNTRNIGIVLGYRTLDFGLNGDSDRVSDIELDLTGPFILLVITG